MRITVIGSLNVDMVTITPRVPEAGETLQATSFEIGWGGKGANQAIAASKLGWSHIRARSGEPVRGGDVIRTSMYGAVGDDFFGPQLLKSMEESCGVNLRGVKTMEGEKTGTAVILVEEQSGENRILLTAGANHALKVEDDLVKDDVDGGYGNVSIFQLEIPFDVTIHHIKKAHAAGSQVIFNPAPAVKLPDYIYPHIAHLVVNETEAAILSELPPDSVTASSDLDAIASDFIVKGVSTVVITLGAQGVFYQTATRLEKKEPGKRVPAAKVKRVVDTTAAGDTFVGAFAVALVAPFSLSAREEKQAFDQDELIDESIAFAIRAAGKTVEKAGAQKSIPTRDEVLAEDESSSTSKKRKIAC